MLHSYVHYIGILCFVLVLKVEAGVKYCYECTSANEGCGEEVDIRIQRWKNCGRSDATCVKIIDKRDGRRFLVRACLNHLENWSHYRMRIPFPHRHGYCLAGKPAPEEGTTRADPNSLYCFCDDWSGCNNGRSLRQNSLLGLIIMIGGAVISRLYS